jgi:hypothetical protein
VSDDPTLADVSADAAQSAETDAPPPWGDDFNADRAWKTISHQRRREAELEPDAKSWKRFREDDEYRREVLSELGYEVGGDDDNLEEDFEDDTPTDDPRLSKFEKFIEEQQAKEANQQFNDHLDTLSGENKLSKKERDWLKAESVQNGFTPQATEKAYKEFVEWRDERDKAAVERYTKSKQAPNTPPQPGRSGEEKRNPRDRNARRAAMAAAMVANEQ